MEDERDLTLAPPIPASDSTETKATSNRYQEHVTYGSKKPKSKLFACMSLENIAQEFECRDEQAYELDMTDLEYRINQDDGIETVLNLLDKNISSARNYDGHELADNPEKRDKKIWTLGVVFDEFLRVHKCAPLLESDDESDNGSCYSRGLESCASGNSRKIAEDRPQEHAEEEDNCHIEDGSENQKCAEDEQLVQKMKIESLQAELDDSREAIISLENQLISSNLPTNTQINQLVSQRREVEELVIQKGMIEAQFACTQQQLTDAKHEAANAAAENERLNRKLANALLELKRNRMQVSDSSEKDSPIIETSRNDPPSPKYEDQSETEQLRRELHGAYHIIKRLEKERRKNARVKEGAPINNTDPGTSLKTENLELRRKCYVTERKLNNKTKMIADLQTELNRVVDELDAKDREKESLQHQIDHLQRLLCDDSKQNVEMDCLQDINESLNAELKSSLEENKSLKEQLRRLKKICSHRATKQRNESSVTKEGDDTCTVQDEVFSIPSTIATDAVSKDVFAKAIKYLNDVQGEEKLSTPVKYRNRDGRGDSTQVTNHRRNNTPLNDEQHILQESRKRFESLRSQMRRK